MKQWFVNRIDKRLAQYVRTRYEMIDVVAEQGMFNWRCFDNAAEWARTHKGHEIFEVIYIDCGSPRLHYVNYDPEAKKYLETTLGYAAPKLEYYKIRRIHPDDHQWTNDEFEQALDSWTKEWTCWYHRWIFRIKRVL